MRNEILEEYIKLKSELEGILDGHLDHLEKFLIGNIDEQFGISEKELKEKAFFFTRPKLVEKKDQNPEWVQGIVSTTFALFSLLERNISTSDIEKMSRENRPKIEEKEKEKEDLEKKLEKQKQDNPKIITNYENIIKQIDDNKNKLNKILYHGILQKYIETLLMDKENPKKLKSGWWYVHFSQPFDIYGLPFKLICIDKIADRLELNKRDIFSDPHILLSIQKIYKNIEITGVARFSRDHDVSGFLTYWCLCALYTWKEFLPKTEEDKEKLLSDHKNVKYAIDPPIHATVRMDEQTPFEINEIPTLEDFAIMFEKSFVWSKQELWKRLAIYLKQDYDRTDPVRATFCLCIYKHFHEFFDSLIECQDQNSEYKNLLKVLKRPDRYSVEYVEATAQNILKEQISFGLWKKYLPVLAIPSNDGNVYPFAPSTFSQLIQITPSNNDTFELFISAIKDFIKWVKQKKKVDFGHRHGGEETQEGEIRYNYAGHFDGWRSEHSSNPDGIPEVWSTALVFHSIHNLVEKLSTEITQETIRLYSGLPSVLKKENIKTRNNIFLVDGKPQDDNLEDYLSKEFNFKMEKKP